jgi:hypothetical protein
LAELGRGLSWRRLSVLMGQLPVESRLVRILNPKAAWTSTEYLLANAVDALQGANWQRGGGKGARPKPIVRPGSNDRKHFGKARSIGETRDLFDRWRDGRLNATPGQRSHIHKRKGVTHGG